MQTPSFIEDHISQIPALQLLQNLGYTYITPEKALKYRGGKETNVILDEILANQLAKINKIEFRDKSYKFSDENIQKAIQALKDFPLKDGLVRTNEKVYDLITLGKSLEQTIENDKKSFNLKYIDWQNFKNNVFHVTEEFSVERAGSTKTRRPDIILFVNGIPFVVIECKRPDLVSTDNRSPVEQAISQNIRNQKSDEIPHLFVYSQLLLSIAGNEAKYGTTGTKEEFWAFWKEQFNTEASKTKFEEKLFEIKNTPVQGEQKAQLFSDRYKYVRNYFDSLESNPIQINEQDKLLYSLCRPERLIELVYRFIVYDAGVKKITRYQQYFAIKNTQKRISGLTQGKRNGGVIWHTQGSGKSLTMVMMAKSIALEPQIVDPKIILVTDRVDLDDQIYKTFKNCGKEVTQAKTGKHLIELITKGKYPLITTIINKFEKAVKNSKAENDSPNIFVLVDESHRSQYGEANIKMQKVFPNACYIGFTGTPIMKKDKNTAKKFGGIIDKYTIDQAVADGAVVPLLYEGRHVVQEVNQKPLDTFFDMVSEPLTDYQKADLKKKFSKADQLNEADQKIYRTSWDISQHFKKEWQGTGYKGQLTAPSKKAALKYKKYLDEIGFISSELIISSPDTREGHDSIYEESDDQVQRFWKNMMERFGNEKTYNKQLINTFKHDEHPEVIIVVDKLLTGFDAPKNTVLYIARSLKEHTLLQAIARVNRVFEGKDFGYIIDYYGILGNLDEALNTYSSLSEFDEEDIEGALTNVKEEIKRLPERHSHLWDIFKTISNKKDIEAYEQLLSDIELREDFYQRVSSFARTLKIALSTLEFSDITPEDKIQIYKDDAKFFLKLRISVKRRYSDTIDYSQYESQIQKLIDTHITSDEVIQLNEQVNIFEKEKFEQEVTKQIGSAAKADMIASRTAKHITENMEDDPVFYKKFSKLLQEVIDAYREKRISDSEYLQKAMNIMNSVQNRTGDEVPHKLTDKDIAKAFYGIAKEIFIAIEKDGIDMIEISADVALKIDEIIRNNIVVDWQMKDNVQNSMRQEIEDYLFSVKGRFEINLDFEQMDDIIEKSLEVAKRRY